MKKATLIILMCAVIALTFFACGKEENADDNKEPTGSVSSEETSTPTVYTYNGDGSENTVNTSDEAVAYLDAEYDSSEKNGNTEVFTLKGKTVMEKTYENGVLVKKIIYSDKEITVDYIYKDGKLESFRAQAKGENGELYYHNCEFYPSGKIHTALFLDAKDAENTDMYMYEFDENGKVIEGYDTPEEISNLFVGIINKGINKIVKGDTVQ